MKISDIAFGGVEIGIPYGIGITSVADMLTEQEAINLLIAAADAGINFFDTARLYGNSEYIIGKAFKNKRQDVILSTKCRHFRDKDGTMASEDSLKKLMEDSLMESLHALQTDYLDIFMLHQADLEILENQAIAEFFTNVKNKGITRAIGASTYTTQETEKAIESGFWDLVQLPFNLMDQRQYELFDIAYEKGIGIIVRSVLLKGLLSDRGKNLHPALQDVQAHIKSYDALLGTGFPDLPTLAIKFALSFKQVTSVLIGMDRMDYLHQSLQAADGKYLDKDQLQKAKDLAYPNPAFLNLPHWDRMGWLT